MFSWEIDFGDETFTIHLGGPTPVDVVFNIVDPAGDLSGIRDKYIASLLVAALRMDRENKLTPAEIVLEVTKDPYVDLLKIRSNASGPLGLNTLLTLSGKTMEEYLND